MMDDQRWVAFGLMLVCLAAVGFSCYWKGRLDGLKDSREIMGPLFSRLMHLETKALDVERKAKSAELRAETLERMLAEKRGDDS
jgi:hypothetical protein